MTLAFWPSFVSLALDGNDGSLRGKESKVSSCNACAELCCDFRIMAESRLLSKLIEAMLPAGEITEH